MDDQISTLNTYWEHQGRHQTLANALQALIPGEGSVEAPAQNPMLERFRLASNYYYDFYNNGFCNYEPEEFRSFFGMNLVQWFYEEQWDTFTYKPEVASKFVADFDRKMDEIIAAAGLEQGLFIPAVA